MFAPPKSTARPKPLVARSQSSGSASGLRKPTATSGSSLGVGGGGLSGTAGANLGRRLAPSAAAQKQASQSSLLAAGKSTSRSSLASDTTASICSSAATFSAATQSAADRAKRAAPAQTGKSSGLPSPSAGGGISGIGSGNVAGNRNGSRITTIGINGLSARAKTGATTIKTASRIISSASSTTSGSSSVTSASSSSSSSSGLPRGSSTTSASASMAAHSRQVPTLAMSLRDKDNQIKLLIKERDEQKFQAELMARRAEEWEEKFQQSELEKSHVTSEADDEVVELRRLAQEFEDENKRLAERLAEREQAAGDIQFKLDEMEIERGELRKELSDREEQLRTMEREQAEVAAGKPVVQITTERAISKQKYEREIEELKEKLLGKEEQMIQLRSSLEMRKNEVTNLQSHAGDLERKLKIESERSERHLKRIDEINLELKAAEAKLATKTEASDMHEKQVRQLRQELRSAEEKLEQISLARKKDIDILHNKLSAARRGSTTPTSPQPYKTPTPQDEIVRLQMEIRDLRDQLIDREAELDCNRRDIEVMRRKMETRTLEVDCNNQELARRCQDLLEQNRQSEDTVKQLLKSTTEHSAQLMRATEDLKEANGKCIKLREEINEMETKLEEEIKRTMILSRENHQLRDENEEHQEQVVMLRQQVDSLNEQLSDLCHQLDVQTNTLHKDRESLADQLSQSEIDSAQMRSDLATARQDLRSSKLQTQEVASERDRLRSDLEMKEKYIRSRNDIIETLRHELDDCKKSLAEHKVKIEELRALSQQELEGVGKELRGQLESIKRECQLKAEENQTMRCQCDLLQRQLDEQRTSHEEEQLRKFDEMRQKHSGELDELKLKLRELSDQLEEAKSATLKRPAAQVAGQEFKSSANTKQRSQVTFSSETLDNEKPAAAANEAADNICSNNNHLVSKSKREEYETQIEFLNSVVVDMQRKCDDYKSRLASIETMNLVSEFDNIILAAAAATATPSGTLTRRPQVAAKPSSSLLSTSSSTSSSSGSGSSNGNSNGTLRKQTQVKQQQQQQIPTRQDSKNLASIAATLTRRTRNDNLERPARISGRPYCDICSVYDLHHTVYCPNVTEKLAARHRSSESNNNNNNNTSNNNINNNNNYSSDDIDFEDIFRQSLESVTIQQFASLRRPAKKLANSDFHHRQLPAQPPPPRPYCDHCDLFGHTIKSCNSLRA